MNTAQEICYICATNAQDPEIIHKSIPLEQALPAGMTIKSIRKSLLQHAYNTHEIACECPLCNEYLDHLADEAAHGPALMFCGQCGDEFPEERARLNWDGVRNMCPECYRERVRLGIEV